MYIYIYMFRMSENFLLLKFRDESCEIDGKV